MIVDQQGFYMPESHVIATKWRYGSFDVTVAWQGCRRDFDSRTHKYVRVKPFLDLLRSTSNDDQSIEGFVLLLL